MVIEKGVLRRERSIPLLILISLGKILRIQEMHASSISENIHANAVMMNWARARVSARRNKGCFIVLETRALRQRLKNVC